MQVILASVANAVAIMGLVMVGFGCESGHQKDRSKSKKESEKVAPTGEEPQEAISGDDEADAQVFLVDAFETDHEVYQGGLGLVNESATESTSSEKKSIYHQVALLLFDVADANQDKLLSLDEFLSFRALATDASLDPAVKANIEKWRKIVFMSGDVDNSGALTFEEAKVVIGKIAKEVLRMRKLRGTDHSDYIKTYWASILAAYDTNKDGKLSRDERKKLRSDADEKIAEYREDIRKKCADEPTKYKVICDLLANLEANCQKVHFDPLKIMLCREVNKFRNKPTSTDTNTATSTSTSN